MQRGVGEFMDDRTETPEERAQADLAQQLHDGPLQLLAVARQELAEAAPSEQVRRASSLLAEASAEIRRLLIRPTRSMDAQLVSQVLARWCSLVLGERCERDVFIADEVSAVDHLTFEAARELISNAARHSGCTTLVVRIEACTGGLRLEVTDDGCGMDPVWTPGFGLTALRGRVAEAGGTVDHRPARPSGTRAVVRVPLKSSRSSGA